MHLDFYKGTIELKRIRKMYQKHCSGSGYYVREVSVDYSHIQFNLDCRSRVYELYVDKIEDMMMWMKYIAIIRMGKLNEAQEIFKNAVEVQYDASFAKTQSVVWRDEFTFEIAIVNDLEDTVEASSDNSKKYGFCSSYVNCQD